MFDVPIQAAIGGRIVSRRQGGRCGRTCWQVLWRDVSRKRKLLEKQAEGKRRMKRVGRVEVPQGGVLALLKVGV